MPKYYIRVPPDIKVRGDNASCRLTPGREYEIVNDVWRAPFSVFEIVNDLGDREGLRWRGSYTLGGINGGTWIRYTRDAIGVLVEAPH